MNNPFKIHINDGSSPIPEIVLKQNESFMNLHNWQRKAVNYFFNNQNKAIFISATGAGKTFCAIEIIKKVLIKDPAIKILIVVPKNIILETSWYKELYSVGISLQDIGVFYGEIKEYSKITITNMQSIHKIALELFDMIIFDEIHNYGTKRLLPYVKHPFKYKLGLTATLERSDNTHWKLMELFDYHVFKYSSKEALYDGILNPFDFINISIEMDEVTYDKYCELTEELNTLLKIGGGFKKIIRSTSGLKYKALAKMNKRKMLINNYSRKFEIIKNICQQHLKDKVIIFNEFNDQTNKCYWYLLDIGVKACIIHSGIESQKRTTDLIGFEKDKFNVILASKVLDEGYNLPKLDVAIIAAGNSTSKQTIQRMGRVLRRKEKPSILYQIYCKNTVEENYARNRSILFKSLCNNYKEFNHQLEESEVSTIPSFR